VISETSYLACPRSGISALTGWLWNSFVPADAATSRLEKTPALQGRTRSPPAIRGSSRSPEDRQPIRIGLDHFITVAEADAVIEEQIGPVPRGARRSISVCENLNKPMTRGGFIHRCFD
jgi:hypothetical protein